uniref:hypothetical protein n=1 Tax=Batrachospermum sp. TaxID=31373 RepID=UPI001FA79367|nr:hypothetical protein MRV80_mgp10 [Batrachospermum sp.]UNB13418.1 hypothetical protein [Batrachospermum sp.]
MQYNYPRLKINYNYLQKYDVLDNNMATFYNPFACINLLQLELINTEKLNFLPILLIQEWFYGQRLIIQNHSLSNTYNKKSTHLKVTVRRINFWNVLDLCLNSIFILEKTKNKFWGIFYNKKSMYSLILPLDLTKVDFLLPKTKESYFLSNFTENQPRSSINFLIPSKNSLQNYFIPYLNLKKTL